MSEQDTTIITEETEEPTPEPSRFKKALDKVTPHIPYLAISVVALGAGALIIQALNKLEDEEAEIVDGEVIVVEPVTD